MPIPANDDAFKSIQLITDYITKSVDQGLMERKKDKDEAKLAEEEKAKREVDKAKAKEEA